jgi:hypothetical protein
MAEIVPAGGGPNRLFVVIAIGLVGLLLLGLIAVGGVLFIPRLLGTSAPPPTVRVAVTTPTRVGGVVALATVPASTDTPVPPATAVITTPVIVPGTPVTSTSTVTATTAITGTPGTGTPIGGQLPQSGMGEDLILLAGGVVLVLIVVAARRARATGAT